MKTRRRCRARIPVALALCGAVGVACGAGDGSGAEAAAAESGGELRPGATVGWPSPHDSIPGSNWTRADWQIFQATLRRAADAALDTLEAGEAVAAMGRLLVGTPYVPRTLEVPGPERLVVNFRGLDCVTFVENALALTRFHRVYGVDLLDQPEAARSAYEVELASLRYREGRPDGYPSRLHYFSDWLRSNAASGRLVLITGDLGGVPDPEPVDFMTSHPGAYDQLAESDVLSAIRSVEAGLNEAGPRLVIPQERIAEAAPGIRTGDVIAATSTVAGLDVAHTGIAVWRDGALHLMHAPLVGDSVVVSDRTLARRIRAIESQDGIMVARPSPDWLSVPDSRGGTGADPGGGGR